jgi:hypothetical protein
MRVRAHNRRRRCPELNRFYSGSPKYRATRSHARRVGLLRGTVAYSLPDFCVENRTPPAKWMRLRLTTGNGAVGCR